MGERKRKSGNGCDGNVWAMMSAEKPLTWDLSTRAWLFYRGRSGVAVWAGLDGEDEGEDFTGTWAFFCVQMNKDGGRFWGCGGGWGVVGVFHVNCDSVILLALFISISPEVRIFCESGWTFLSICFFFPFNCVGQFWRSAWHEWNFSLRFYLESGTQSSRKFF